MTTSSHLPCPICGQEQWPQPRKEPLDSSRRTQDCINCGARISMRDGRWYLQTRPDDVETHRLALLAGWTRHDDGIYEKRGESFALPLDDLRQRWYPTQIDVSDELRGSNEPLS